VETWLNWRAGARAQRRRDGPQDWSPPSKVASRPPRRSPRTAGFARTRTRGN